MRRAKSIDELYEEVKGFDIVLTTDAALATALNAKIDVPRIGGFAYTPRHLAKDEAVPFFGAGVLSDLKIITEIANETGFSLKYIHSELENIRNIRKYKKEVRKYLYSKASNEVYDSFLGLRSVEKLMDSYTTENSTFFEGKKVAVIGLDLFDDLDKHFIPPDHEEIDIFTDGNYEIDEIFVVGNDRQLAENAVSLITRETASDIAIVLDTKGPIADAVRAALYRKNIPFKNTMSVKDLSQVRDFLQFVDLSLSYETLRVRHVRELFSVYGGKFNQKEDEYLLYKIEPLLEGRQRELVEIAKNIRNMTFLEVCDRVVRDNHRPQIKMLLDDMRIKDTKVSSIQVNELTYAVNNISDLHHNEQIPDEEKKGVLLADCLRSVYVDRPFVIYLGLGPEWSYVSIGKDYVDKETEADQNLLRFSVLLQQGVSRVYAVNSMRNGKAAVPCPIFDQMIDSPDVASGFGSISTKITKGQWASTERNESFSRPNYFNIPPEAKDWSAKNWQFSKSSFNKYYACPRAYMFSTFIHSPDNENTLFGDIIHQFAEFYLCYPGLVEGKIGHYSEMIREKYSGLSSQQMKGIDWSKIRVCMTNIIRFVDTLDIKNVPLDKDNSERKKKNMFMEMHKDICKKYSSLTEAEFTSYRHPLFGYFDLLAGSRIIDFKTGKAGKPGEIVQRMNMDNDLDYYEFQPLVYLSLLREKAPPPQRFSLVYLAANDVRSVTDSDFSISENVIDVVLIGESMEKFLSDPDSPAKKRFSVKIREGWATFVKKAYEVGGDPSWDWKDDPSLISSIMYALGMKENKTNRETVSAALKRLVTIIAWGVYNDKNTITVPSDTLEDFLSSVDAHHAVASVRRYTEFPAEPRGKCSKCEFFKVCTNGNIDKGGVDADE